MSDEQITAAAEKLLGKIETHKEAGFSVGFYRNADVEAVARFAHEAAARITELEADISRARAYDGLLGFLGAFLDAWREDRYLSEETRYRWHVMIGTLSTLHANLRDALAASTAAPEGRGEEAVDDAPRR